MEDQRQRTDLAAGSISFFPRGNSALTTSPEVQKVISSFPHLSKVEKTLHIPLTPSPHLKLKLSNFLPKTGGSHVIYISHVKKFTQSYILKIAHPIRHIT
jgi:hypothetical protein